MLKLPNVSVTNTVDAHARTIRNLLDTVKYDIDVFQREYRWKKEQIMQLLSDLESKFLSEYQKQHERSEVQKYSRYYLGTIIINLKDGRNSIIDGQQRLTSITLLLIYLHNLQKPCKDQVDVKNLIFSEQFARKSYNLDIEDRLECMDALYHGKNFNSSIKNESVANIIQRYEDIEEFFPYALKGDALPYFIDWLIENVVLVEIKTHSDDDAYTIFETMNDRGLSLTPTEMLKGYLLSKLDSKPDKSHLNKRWKQRIVELRNIDETEDMEFFKAWFRAKYAESIRPRKKGAENGDFEKIALKFHNWVRGNKKRIGLNSSASFHDFIRVQFDFFSELYLKIYRASVALDERFEHVFYVEESNFPSSFYSPLIMSPIKVDDDEETIQKKIALVSKFLETFIVYRFINNRTLSYSSINYTMFNLIKEIRDKNVTELAKILKDEINNFQENLDGMLCFRLNQQNKRHVRFLLARITRYIEGKCGVQSSFKDYVTRDSPKPFEIEHIWADKFEEHKDEFDQEEFAEFRNRIGALILIPEGFNQSYGDKSYEEKLSSYFGQNLLAKTLSPQCYENNPSFVKYVKESKLPFKAHERFRKSDLQERQKLYQKICEKIWSIDEFDEIASNGQTDDR